MARDCCGNCAHWLTDPAAADPERYAMVGPVPGYGRCAMISDPPEIVSTAQDRSALGLPAYVDVDDPYITAPFMTTPTFHCDLHEIRIEPEP